MRLSIALAAAVLGLSPVLAEESQSPTASQSLWAGTFFGIQAGGGWADHNRLSTSNVLTTYSGSGVIGGVLAGHNWISKGGSLWGVEANINASGVKGDDGGARGSTDTTAFRYSGTLNARVGIPTERALVFLSGGFAFAGITQTLSNVNLAGPGLLYGWNIGAGIDHQLYNGWIGRLAYRYTNYMNAGLYTGNTISSPFFPATPFNVDTRTHDIMVGVLKFLD